MQLSETSVEEDEDNPDQDFPEYANEENKELNQKILGLKKDIVRIDLKIDDF